MLWDNPEEQRISLHDGEASYVVSAHSTGAEIYGAASSSSYTAALLAVLFSILMMTGMALVYRRKEGIKGGDAK